MVCLGSSAFHTQRLSHNIAAQGSIADLIGKLFGIKTGFQGTIVSNLAKLNFSSVTEVVNDKHLEPWTAMCTEVCG